MAAGDDVLTAAGDRAGVFDSARQAVAVNPTDEMATKRLWAAVQSWTKDVSAPTATSESRLSRPVAKARKLLTSGAAEEAEVLLRKHLKRDPDDVAAMQLMAEIAARCGFPENAVLILRRSLNIDPALVDGWVTLARVHDQLGQVGLALSATDEALKLDGRSEVALALKATLLVKLRRLTDAAGVFDKLIRLHPHGSIGWMNYGFLLKTLGKFGQAVAAYRIAAALNPLNGPAWWGLANLKLAPMFADDIAAMEAALSGQMDENSRIDLHFALAKAYDSIGDYEKAAAHLDQGNARRKAMHPYDAEAATRDVQKGLATFSADFFVRREGWGDPARDPIFIVGMPRSGSTLIEQILASHSTVEGTEELFNVQRIAAQLAQSNEEGSGFEPFVARLSNEELTSLGRRYIEETRRFRKTGRARFTDKMPGNWRYLGLIHTMLPNAKIIDIRRDPLDCCFANYAQHFMWGVRFAYNQRDLSYFYRDYVQTMRHFDKVLPGRVHRIIYEDLVDNLEAEVRRLLTYLDLPFEAGCLEFHETKRAVHTPSSEQVRQPIYRSGIGRARHYEPWLEELRTELGEVATDYRW